MRNLIILQVIFICSSAFSKSPEDSLKNLIPSLLGKDSKNQIKTSGCKLQKEKWAMLLLTKESFTEKIDYNTSCDLKGKFTVQMDKFFSIKLDIRNHQTINALNGKAKIALNFTNNETLLSVELKDAETKGKDNISFKTNYTIAIDPFAKPITKKHIGGSIFINKINTQKVYKSYPLKFN